MSIIRIISTVFIMIVSGTASASDLCTRYESKPEYINAINIVAQAMGDALPEFCQNETILDIQVSPYTYVTPNGEEIPHLDISLHYNDYSCVYLVNRANPTITKNWCYSSF